MKVPALLLCAALIPNGGVPAAAPPERPNVLIIVVDDVALSDVDRIPTPNMDRLASTGVSFRRAYTMPVCSQTRYSGFFGEYRGVFSGDTCAEPFENTPLHTRFSLAKMLEARGYATGMFGKWHIGANRVGGGELTPHLHGFEVVRAVSPGNAFDCGGTGYWDWVRYDDGRVTREDVYHTIAVRDALLSWWQSTTEPRFAWVAFNAAHAPLHTPPPELLPPGYPAPHTNRQRYESMVVSLDVVLGQILDVVDLSDTWLFFLADNGTPAEGKRPDQRKGTVKGSTFEDGVRVPFLVAGPGTTRSFETDALIHAADLPATVAELVGATLPGGAARDSVSFRTSLEGADTGARDHLICDYEPPVSGTEFPGSERGRDRAVVARVKGRFWKLRRKGETLEELFDLEDDPREVAPLDRSDQRYGKVLEHLRGWLDDYEARPGD